MHIIATQCFFCREWFQENDNPEMDWFLRQDSKKQWRMACPSCAAKDDKSRLMKPGYAYSSDNGELIDVDVL